ncbi:hypothetical protein [Microbacterium sp. SS28]|uniref:hypothetical protein n=1 Tax=Microbacterium sp. SS28 TaxID=2919948 RepID=UPI001FA977C4|nr:hypothetical protein [Microbacterium sp. SS28]
MDVADELLDENAPLAEVATSGEPQGGHDASGDSADAIPPQYGVGPFSIREVAIFGVWVLAFVASFFSLSLLRFDSLWTSGLAWILTIGVPTAAVFLLVLRRLSPTGIRRVGSLGIDQFASVAFSVSTVVWLSYIWETVAFVADGGPWVRSWVMWLEFVLMLAGVVLTVFAPFIPGIGDDFRHRPEAAAHRNARPLRAITPRPAPEPRPVAEPEAAPTEPSTSYEAPYGQTPYDAAPYGAADYGTAGYESPYAGEPAGEQSWAPQTAVYETPAVEPVPEPDPEPAPVRQQAFWALAPEGRDVVDEQGAPLFRIGPDAWALVIEDRGEVFVVRHEDGRIGYLHDIDDVTRG